MMRLIDADALLEHQVEADKMGAMLVVGKGFIMDAPTITPQPDPITGLVPCGCGGKAVRHIIGHQHMVVCENDCVWTLWHDTQAEADKAWNTAHGYKEDI